MTLALAALLVEDEELRIPAHHDLASLAVLDQRLVLELNLAADGGLDVGLLGATLGLGIWLLSLNSAYYFSQGWMHAKLTLVVALVIYHHLCGAQLKRFARGENSRSHVFYRWFNEAPVLALLGIVILVVVSPF